MSLQTVEGIVVPAITAEQMREVDRIAAEEFGLGILQMMENAGRSLAENVPDMLDGSREEVAILAGSGGNGGGGLCCARHLHNRGLQVWVILSKKAAALKGAARDQLRVLEAAGVQPVVRSEVENVLRRSSIVVDALIGYRLRGAPRGSVAELIKLCNRHAARVLSLDVPSGLDATTGEAPGVVVHPERTLTLALPKTGLRGVDGDLYVADIGIPPEVFHRIGVSFEPYAAERYWTRLLAGDET
jgi:NAD(P)H-hydrate epimerase